jgi:ribonuclease J
MIQNSQQPKNKVERPFRRPPDPRFNRRPNLRDRVFGAQKLRVFGLGGLEEVGRNMTVFEYGPDIVIVDMGLMFPEEDMPGIDYIIPDITYLRNKIKNIRGVFITHAHYDHIGAISHLIPDLGYPTIYTTKLSAGIIKKRHEEYNLRPLTFGIIDPDTDKIKLGSFFVEFFRVNHNIPDSFGLALQTPVGTVVHTGDFKIDFSPINDKPADLTHIAQIGSRGVLALLSDSTDAEHLGYQISESDVGKDIDTIFYNTQGMIIVGTFASLLNRVQQLISLAEKHGRKVYLDGRSMISNVEIAHGLGYLKIKPGTLIEQNQFLKLPRNKVIMIGTGAQGEKNAVLMRIANKEHKFLEIVKGDAVIFSSSVIPGNERSIQSLKDTFYRQGAKVYHYKMMDVHAGGHAKQEDLKLMMRLLKPKYFMPIEANFYMRAIHGELATTTGIPEANVFLPNNGQVVEFSRQGRETTGIVTKEQVPTEYIMVDGLGVGDVSNIVLRDRQVLSDDGMFVVIVTIQAKTGILVGSPDIISRGFVYMKESKKLIEEARAKVKKICKDTNPAHAADLNEIKNKIRNEMGKFLYKKTERRPMVLPVVIEV